MTTTENNIAPAPGVGALLVLSELSHLGRGRSVWGVARMLLPNVKTCSLCKATKPLADFSMHNGKKRSECRICAASIKREWRRTHSAESHTRDASRRIGVRTQLMEGKPFSRVCLWLRDARWRAKAKNRPCTVGIPFLLALWETQEGRCALCGLPFDLSPRRPMSPSLDRIDAGLGYVPGNVRFVALALNYAMQAWGEDAISTVLQAFCARKSGAA
jgi:hypothetical protein